MKIAIVIILAIVIFVYASSRTTVTAWDKIPKHVVSNQCAVFSKIGANYKKWTNDDINFLNSSMKDGVNLKKLTEYEIKTSQCCATYIMTKYNQDFYMKQDDVTLLMQESLNSCR
ncbi:MAG TPA: hypothetical protein CFH84_06215 [Sulfurimonas sp. UBA12504]|nr:MAG: hypothetical protein A2019_05670 [Sulfurimonas sp. GWF2_37_8]DAB30064.1 MAG TPA: hypothetical protein CFH84_06215 [Sulfurimonas sp. UBA12504]